MFFGVVRAPLNAITHNTGLLDLAGNIITAYYDRGRRGDCRERAETAIRTRRLRRTRRRRRTEFGRRVTIYHRVYRHTRAHNIIITVVSDRRRTMTTAEQIELYNIVRGGKLHTRKREPTRPTRRAFYRLRSWWPFANRTARKHTHTHAHTYRFHDCSTVAGGVVGRIGLLTVWPAPNARNSIIYIVILSCRGVQLHARV